MKKLIILTLFLMTSMVSYAQFAVNPKVGLNFSRLSADPQDGEDKSRWGFNVGADFRFGDRFKIISGIHYARYGTTLRSNSNQQDIEDDVKVHLLRIPVVASINIVNLNMLQWRVYGGVSGNVFLKVDDNAWFTKDNFKPLNYGLRIGSGVDFTILTLDVDYEVGLGKVFSGELIDKLIYPKNATNNVLTLSAGVRINGKDN